MLPRSRSSADQLGSAPPLSLSASEPSYEMPWAAMMQGLAPYFIEAAFANGEQIFRRGEAALSIHFIVTGEVTLYEPPDHSLSPAGPAEPKALSGVRGGSNSRGGGNSRGTSRPQSLTSPGSTPSSTPSGRRLMRYVNGGIFGEH